MQSNPSKDANDLALVDAALASKVWLLPVPLALRARYAARHLHECRTNNRFVIVIVTIIFDLFVLDQARSSPELVFSSMIMRLVVFTPLVGVFVLLDMRDRFGRWYGYWFVCLAVSPTFITSASILMTPATDLNAAEAIRSTPLILMATGLIARHTPREAIVTAVLSVGAFAVAVFLCVCVPRAQIGTMVLFDVSIGACSIGLNLQFERRDRRLFLLGVSEAIRRTALTERNERLLAQVQTDGLTGVGNRRCFNETYEQAWKFAQERGSPIAVVLMDIDHFKKFNDFYGHQGGDDCLRLVAGRAIQEVRTSDSFARYGGEEFVVILPGALLETAVGVAERMRVAVEGLQLRHDGLGVGVVVTVSLGAASMVPSVTDDPRQLVEMADTNLYAAKRAGRNRVCAVPDDPALALQSFSP